MLSQKIEAKSEHYSAEIVGNRLQKAGCIY